MAGECERRERSKTFSLVYAIAVTVPLVAGLKLGIDSYNAWRDKRVEVERKAPIETSEEAKNIEDVITRLEDKNGALEERAKNKLRKFLALVGVREEDEVEYFHIIMQDEKFRTIFREYVEECVSNRTKPSKDGFRCYLARDSF